MRLRLAYDPVTDIGLTGSTGYIGSSLANSDLLRLKQVASLDELPPGCVVIHLAAAVAGQERQTMLDNLALDSSLIEWAESNGSYIVYASSNNVYANAIDCCEGDTPRVQDYYSASKIFGETLGRAKLGRRFCALRIGDVFGAGQRHGRLFQAIEASIASKSPLVQLGEGLKLRSYIYIRELVQQMLHAADLVKRGAASEIYNVAHSDPLTVRQLLARISELSALPIDRTPLAPDESHLDVRTMRINPLPCYVPSYSMDSALEDYVTLIKGKP